MPEPTVDLDASSEPTIPEISVVVPVWNGASVLPRCLEAISRTEGITFECIVVDDGSSDESSALARRWGARILSTSSPQSGPARARNVGAQVARAPLLCFVDADILIRPDTLVQFSHLLDSEPGVVAAFGSYDTRPAVREPLSEYRNLLHHFVHQTGREAASTFWAGCGVVRADVFRALGGFSPTYTRPSVEDIELGYRIRAAGGDIRLAKDIQVTHLKRWTFLGILQTDIRDRAIPWTALIARTRNLPNDLNLDVASRLSAVSVYVLVLLALVGLAQPLAWAGTALPLCVLLACNHGLYQFLARQRGPLFLLQALPMHWLYFGYSAAVFGAGLIWYRWRLPAAANPGLAGNS